MNLDDRDLAAPFEELTAPPSTAGYRQHRVAAATPGRARPALGERSWRSIAGAALAVVLAVAGAATFVGLRNARHVAPATAGVGSAPPARTNAAMAFDSTSGRTVLYGGTDGGGRALTDTWAWDGTTWTAVPTPATPGRLISLRMADDPADGGVLLVGMPEVAPSGISATGCAVSGGSAGSSGSTGSSGTGSVTIVPPAAPVESPSASPAPAVPSGFIAAPPCPSIVITPSLETWLLTGHGWSRVSSGTGAGPAAISQMAYDTASGAVVAIQGPSIGFACGTLLKGANSTAIVCPLMGSSRAGVACPASVTLPCPAPCADATTGSCATAGTVSTWTWAHGRWLAQPHAGGPVGTGSALVFSGPDDQHAELLVSAGFGCAPPLPVTPLTPTMPCAAMNVSTSLWSWNGSSWQRTGVEPASAVAGVLGGALAGRTGGRLVLVDATGGTWLLSGDRWTRQPAGGPSPRSGAALAVLPGGQLILFGGLSSAVVVGSSVSSSTLHPGSDTWRWQSGSWTHVSGALAPTPAPATPCATAKGGTVNLGCPVPQPGVVGPPVSAPAGTPDATPQPAATASP